MMSDYPHELETWRYEKFQYRNQNGRFQKIWELEQVEKWNKVCLRSK